LQLLSTAPYPAVVAWGPDHIQFNNEAYTRLVGANDQCDAHEFSTREAVAELRPVMEPRIEESMRTGASVVVEDHLICPFRNGYAEETYLTLRFDPIPDDAADVGGVLITVTDTTDRVIGRRRTAALHGLASAVAGAASIEEASRRALDEIARHPTDIAFALLYAPDTERDRVRLVATAGLSAGGQASPEVIELRSEAADWPIGDVLTRNEVVALLDLPAHFGTLPGGDWPLAPRCALLVPLTPFGGDQPDFVLVVGVSARRAPDAEYRRFVELIAQQVATAVAMGRAHEEQARRARVATAAAKRARARRQAHERALEARFAGVLEERSRMAREIHDTLLQGFTGITLQLEAVMHDLTREPQRAKMNVERILSLADHTLADARQAVWDMRAPALRAQSLTEAMRDIVRRAVDGAPPDVRFRLTGSPRPLAPAAEMALFRIAQEAVANAVKHAAATFIEVELAYERCATQLKVCDDGQGFEADTPATVRGAHWGLLGMRERAEQIGAYFDVKSAPRCGTEVTVTVQSHEPAPRRDQRLGPPRRSTA